MADDLESNRQFLAPPVLPALRKDESGRGRMERTASMDMREEREDLKEAAEQSMNVILDLSLDGTVRWVSPSWRDVIGTPVESVQGKPIGKTIILDDGYPNGFSDAIELMKKDDSRSQIVRFKVRLGPSSLLRQDSAEAALHGEEESLRLEEFEQEEVKDELLSLEGQGIMVHDRSSSGESHVSLPWPLTLKLFLRLTYIDHVDDSTSYSA